MTPESLAGRLLVASATLQDPNFARTVVLIGLHSEEGALGLVLNRPSSSSVASAVPQLSELLDEDQRVFVGGPVQGSSIVMLAEFTDPDAAGLLVLGRIGLPAPETSIEDLAAARLRRLRGLVGGTARRGDRGRRLDRSRRAARGRLQRGARAALEHRAHPQGRTLRAARPDAARPEPELETPPERRLNQNRLPSEGLPCPGDPSMPAPPRAGFGTRHF